MSGIDRYSGVSRYLVRRMDLAQKFRPIFVTEEIVLCKDIWSDGGMDEVDGGGCRRIEIAHFSEVAVCAEDCGGSAKVE